MMPTHGYPQPVPPPKRRRFSPTVVSVLALVALLVVGAAVGAAVLVFSGGDEQQAEATPKDPAAEVFDRCKQYDGVQGASVSSGEGYVLVTERFSKTTTDRSGVLECIQRATDLPGNVMDDIYATSMLMGRQEAEWGGWSLTYDVKNNDAAFELRMNLRVKDAAQQE